MKISQLFIAITVSSIILFSYSIYPHESYIVDKSQIYISSSSGAIIKFSDFGGFIKVIIQSKNKNISIYLDEKPIKSGKWVSTGYVGIHNLSIKSQHNTTVEISIITKEPSMKIKILLGISVLIGFIGLITIKNYEKRKTGK